MLFRSPTVQAFIEELRKKTARPGSIGKPHPVGKAQLGSELRPSRRIVHVNGHAKPVDALPTVTMGAVVKAIQDLAVALGRVEAKVDGLIAIWR